MAKHTPAPWTVEEYGDDESPSLVIHKGTATRVCFMATPGSHGDPARIEADARLIAAAPEMVEALKDLARLCEAVRYSVGLGKSQLDRIEKAKSIIAKVESAA